jgi:hypothetical protein
MFGGRKKASSADASSPSTHREFFEKTLTAAGEWSRFADPKVLGVFVFLGLGLSNLLKVSDQLWEAHHEHNVGGWLATGGFVAAGVFAGLAVLFASVALFPQLRPGGKKRNLGAQSLFFFNHVAEFDSAQEYEQAVLKKSADELRSDVASQAWAVARVATNKHRRARKAYVFAVLFLVAWATARIALSFL